ncbi:hypothetical protein D3C72_589620 [compost metagenome]
MEIPQTLLIVARIRAHMPHAGLRAAFQWIVEAIKTIFRLADDGSRHLPIRAQHFQLHRLIGQRFAVAVAQQTVEDHGLPGTIEIARAKHKELLAITRPACDIKFRQVQRREFKIQ